LQGREKALERHRRGGKERRGRSKVTLGGHREGKS
jgi:hypothetical protein